MNQRIKKIRKDSGLTQEEFSRKVGTSRTNIAKYEAGINDPSNAAISLICRAFNINEQWLRTGQGEQYIKLETNQTVAISASLLGQHDPLFESIVEVYSKLTDSNKEVLLNIMINLVNTYHAKIEEN